MAQVKEGQLIGSGSKFGIVVARFNEFICSKLLGGAYDALHRHGVNDNDVTTAWVPLSAVQQAITIWFAMKRLKALPRHR